MYRLDVWQLGRVEYADGLQLQKLFGDARARDLVPDTLLLLEHPAVLTLGRGAKRQNIVADAARLAAQDVEVFETNRGGDVTYHGPGQVVGYPIFRLPPDRHDVRRYVRDLEQAMILALAPFGIQAEPMPKWPGVWIGSGNSGRPEKIGAIGVHLSRWQTSHGFALNVNTDLSHFELIVHCGITEGGVTSMQRQLSRRVEMGDVERELARSFGEVFSARVELRAPAMRTVSVCAVRVDPSGHQVLLLRRIPERGGFWQIVTGSLEPGESPEQTAARELLEETGQPAAVHSLGYRHAFAFGETIPPLVVQEEAFVARLSGKPEVRLYAAEHDAFRWLSPEDAVAQLPFQGLRRAVQLAVRSLR